MADILKACSPGAFVFIDVPQESPAETTVLDFHEHINFFTPVSVRRLIERMGLNLLKVSIAEINKGARKSQSIFALAQVG